MINVWGEANTIRNALRDFCVIIDKVIYFLLDFVYKIFFQIANFELFNDSMEIPALFSRLQLLIGLFMVFKLSFSIINGIINPDSFVDKKAGFSNVVVRTITMLFVLLLVVPVNIPNASSNFEKEVKNNGILFGTLYSLQERIMFGNTIGRIILGTSSTIVDENGEELSEEEIQDKKVEKASAELGVSILKAFVGPAYKDVPAEYADPSDPKYFACDDKPEIYNTYTNATKVGDIFDLVDERCGKTYAVNYIPVFSGLTAGIIAFIIIGFTVDVAVRTIKLTILRVVAPIPIVSYIEPKAAKDGAFGSWVKALTSTYLDLFIRLAIIYFGVFLVNLLIEQIFVVDDATNLGTLDLLNEPGKTMVNLFTFVMMVIGVFIFMKISPKFIKDMLGLKGNSNIGLSGMMTGAGTMFGSLKAGEGLSLGETGRAMIAGSNMQIDAYNQGKAGPGIGQSFASGADNVLKTITGNDKMTLARYGSNQRFARKYKLDDSKFNDDKNYMYRLEEEATRAEDAYSNASFGRYSVDELMSINDNMVGVDNKYKVDVNDFVLKNNNGTHLTDKNNKPIIDEEGYKKAVTSKMFDYKLDTNSKFGKQKKKVESLSSERKVRGFDRSFSYDSDYKARRKSSYNPIDNGDRSNTAYTSHPTNNTDSYK